MRLIINSERSLSNAILKMRDIFASDKYFTISINTGKKRTLSQNSIMHSWFSEVSKKESEYTPGEVKNLCKYHFGLPIMRGADEHFNDACVACIDPLPYENKIKAMEYLPVTSLMNTKQLSEFMDAIQRHYSGRVNLIFPEESP